jgi:thioredoxin 1
MSPISPIGWKVIAAATLLIAGGLLYACPSSGQCPLVQIFKGAGSRTAGVQPETIVDRGGAESAVAAEPDSNSPLQEGEAMPAIEPKPVPVCQVLHASVESFEQLVLESKGPVLVDFYADWCRPCQILSPTLDELARELPDARIVKVNVDQDPELAGYFGVSSIPALMVFKDGNLVAKRLGVVDKASLKQLLGS